MPEIIDILLIILLLGMLIAITYRVITKNKKILFKGHDDYIYSAIILVVILAINPVSETMGYYGILRSLLLILVVFAQFAIKRGISENGFEKVYFTLPWDKIDEVYIQSLATSANKIAITVQMKNKLKFKLNFNINKLREIVAFLETKLPEIKVEKELVDKYNKYSKGFKK